MLSFIWIIFLYIQIATLHPFCYLKSNSGIEFEFERHSEFSSVSYMYEYEGQSNESPNMMTRTLMSEDCLCQHSQELIPLSLSDVALSLWRSLSNQAYLFKCHAGEWRPGVTHCTSNQCWLDHSRRLSVLQCHWERYTAFHVNICLIFHVNQRDHNFKVLVNLYLCHSLVVPWAQ